MFKTPWRGCMARSRALQGSSFPQKWAYLGEHIGHVFLYFGFHGSHNVRFLFMFFLRCFLWFILGRLEACKLCSRLNESAVFRFCPLSVLGSFWGSILEGKVGFMCILAPKIAWQKLSKKWFKHGVTRKDIWVNWDDHPGPSQGAPFQWKVVPDMVNRGGFLTDLCLRLEELSFLPVLTSKPIL